MEKIEAAATEITAADARTKEEAIAIESERKQLGENAEKVETELVAIGRERDELAARIEAPLLAKYQKRADSLAGKVVVEARGESCSGCFMSIPPQLFVNVKKNTEVLTCPHCSRILYYKEAITPK
jgi:predicted  nucleic acid-binding Zn-ribbon protein